MKETQESISQWANDSFGPVATNARVAARANEEMAELLRALTADDEHPKAAEELADIVIVLSRLASLLGVNLQDEIDRKMAINRERVWKRDNTGHGYHVRAKEIPVDGKYHGCHDCGEERIPKRLHGRLLCPECDSENIICIEP